jgi:hypothetical protein
MEMDEKERDKALVAQDSGIRRSMEDVHVSLTTKPRFEHRPDVEEVHKKNFTSALVQERQTTALEELKIKTSIQKSYSDFARTFWKSHGFPQFEARLSERISSVFSDFEPRNECRKDIRITEELLASRKTLLDKAQKALAATDAEFSKEWISRQSTPKKDWSLVGFVPFLVSLILMALFVRLQWT